MRSLEVALRRVRSDPVTIDTHNVDKMLERRKGQLRDKLHAVLMELYIMHLKFCRAFKAKTDEYRAPPNRHY